MPKTDAEELLDRYRKALERVMYAYLRDYHGMDDSEAELEMNKLIANIEASDAQD